MQFAKEKAYCEMKDKEIMIKVKSEEERISGGEEEEEEAEALLTSTLKRALTFYSTLQCDDGFWPADNGGPLFLLPGLVSLLSRKLLISLLAFLLPSCFFNFGRKFLSFLVNLQPL